jgi:hypothetical protein
VGNSSRVESQSQVGAQANSLHYHDTIRRRGSLPIHQITNNATYLTARSKVVSSGSPLDEAIDQTELFGNISEHLPNDPFLLRRRRESRALFLLTQSMTRFGRHDPMGAIVVGLLGQARAVYRADIWLAQPVASSFSDA